MAIKIVFVTDQAITSQLLEIFPKCSLILCSLNIRIKNIYRKLDSKLLRQKVASLLYTESHTKFNHVINGITSSDV